jgi:hypothetical protein
MLVLVFLVEWRVVRKRFATADGSDFGYQSAVRAAAEEARGARVLLLGDSLVKTGLLPAAVRERAGRSAYNLAVAGSQAPAAEAIWARALGAGARPEAVVIGFDAKLLARPARYNLGYWPSVLTLADSARLAWSAGDADVLTCVILARLFPSYHGRAAARAGALDALAGRYDGRIGLFHLLRRHLRSNGGAMLFPRPEPPKPWGAAEVAEYRRGYDHWACDPANAAAIDRLLAAAAAHGVPVYWVLPPLTPALRAETARNGFDQAFDAFLRSWQARYPGLTVLDARAAVADPADFTDPSHLSAPGARAFSLAAADALGASLSSPTPRARRLTVSPAASPPANAPSLGEDIDESRLAIARRLTPRG